MVKLAGDGGVPIWTVPLSLSAGSPAIALSSPGDVVVVEECGDTRCVVRLEGATGAEIWRNEPTPAGGWLGATHVAVTPAGVFVAGAVSSPGAAQLLGIAADTGAPLWTLPLPYPAPNGSSPLSLLRRPDGDLSLLLAEFGLEVSVTLDVSTVRAEDGAVLATRRLPGAFQGGMSLATNGDALVVGTGVLARLAASDLHRLWSLDTTAYGAPLGAFSPGTPATGATRLYVPGAIVAVDSVPFVFTVVGVNLANGDAGICGRPVRSDGATLTVGTLRHRASGISWTLRGGPSTTLARLGDPRSTSGYVFSVYDSGAHVVLRATAPAGACSRRTPCWRRTSNGFEYTNRRAPNGLSRLVLRAGPPGRAAFRVVGGGEHLVLPALPIADRDLRVELRRSDDPDVCWTADHTDVTRNLDTIFRARGD